MCFFNFLYAAYAYAVPPTSTVRLGTRWSSQAVTGHVTAEIPRQYIITDLHLHAVRQRERTETREVHNKTRNSFPKLQNGKRDGRHLSPTKKETTEEGIHP